MVDVSLVEWSQDLSVSIEEVDAQHKQLVAMLNELHAALSTGRGREALQGILDGLAEYAVYHFATEENLFETHDFPATAVHKTQHADFVERVSAFTERHARGEGSLSIDVLNFLADWLTAHIQGSDKEFGRFLNERGAR
jgi:hemerythrin